MPEAIDDMTEDYYFRFTNLEKSRKCLKQTEAT